MIVYSDVDPTKVESRARDTENEPTPKPPTEWSDWRSVSQFIVDGDPADQKLAVVLLGVANLLGPGSAPITVTVPVVGEGALIRTVEYQVRLASAAPIADKAEAPVAAVTRNWRLRARVTPPVEPFPEYVEVNARGEFIDGAVADARKQLDEDYDRHFIMGAECTDNPPF